MRFPACAGVILLPSSMTAYRQTFPRKCGGDPYTIDKSQLPLFFSPHVRGFLRSRRDGWKMQYEYMLYKNEYMLKIRENTCIFLEMGVS